MDCSYSHGRDNGRDQDSKQSPDAIFLPRNHEHVSGQGTVLGVDIPLGSVFTTQFARIRMSRPLGASDARYEMCSAWSGGSHQHR